MNGLTPLQKACLKECQRIGFVRMTEHRERPHPCVGMWWPSLTVKLLIKRGLLTYSQWHNQYVLTPKGTGWLAKKGLTQRENISTVDNHDGHSVERT